MIVSEFILIGISTANWYIERAVIALLAARRVNKEISVALIGQFNQNQIAAIEGQGVMAIEFDDKDVIEYLWKQFNRSAIESSKSKKTYYEFIHHYQGIEPFLHPFTPKLTMSLGYKYTLFLDSDNIAIHPIDFNLLTQLESHAWIGACALPSFRQTKQQHKKHNCYHINAGFIGYNNQLWLRHQGPRFWLRAMTEYMALCSSKKFCSHVYLGDGGVVLQLIRDIRNNITYPGLGPVNKLSFTTVDWRFNALCHAIPCPDFGDLRPPYFFHSTRCFPVPQCLLNYGDRRNNSLFIRGKKSSMYKITQILIEFPHPLIG